MPLKRGGNAVTLVLAVLLSVGVVLVTLSIVLPAQPVTTCLTNEYGTFCTVHSLVGSSVVNCPAVSQPVSCMRTPWFDPIPFLYFWTVDIGIAGMLLVVAALFVGVRFRCQ